MSEILAKRRGFLTGAAAAIGTAGLYGYSASARLATDTPAPPRTGRVRAMSPSFSLAELERRTFAWFWDLSDNPLGLTPDRWPTKSFSSIAATGFALSAYLYGVNQGWVSRAAAAERVLRVLRFFAEAPQGRETKGVTGYRGFYYHFIDMEKGHRFAETELSSIDTALLMAGVLSAETYFTGDTAQEAEIRLLARLLIDRVEWDWMLDEGPFLAKGWHPESGFIPYQWDSYNEAMILYILAIGSRTHGIERTIWPRLTARFAESWGEHWGEEYLHFGPLFGHQYSHIWIDFRGIRDGLMSELGIDYFQNSRRAVYAQRNYAIQNPGGFAGYGANIWGLTACDGPGNFKTQIDGREREFYSYYARGAGGPDDGTIAPTAVGGSVAFAPEICEPALAALYSRYGPYIYGEYGFLDCFNPSLTSAEGITLQHGRIAGGELWVDGDYLGIDQGPILLMAANHRSKFLWSLMRRSPDLVRGLRRAGFSKGWLG